MRLERGEPLTASADVPHPVWNELDDHPHDPPPYGSAGWTADDGAFLFYDRFDVWRFEPESGRTINLTAGAGRESQTRFRYARTEPELDHIPEGEALWQAFHDQSKQGGLYQGRTDREASPAEVVMADKSFRLRGKAKDADRWLLTREDFREFPDLWVTDRGITDMQRVSDANPQQADYRWGSAELVEWTSNDGVELQGMLFKPDGFDPAEKYPLLVYFYERMSDGLHTWRTPRPGSSSVSVPFYVSRGYVMFIPDIPYEIGYPGESALDAVVPGVLDLLDEGFVDRDRIGVQGHSWGGYQIAYMITKTDLFAAAEAGAPVSNMTSAYGGIRWQTRHEPDVPVRTDAESHRRLALGSHRRVPAQLAAVLRRQDPHPGADDAQRRGRGGAVVPGYRAVRRPAPAAETGVAAQLQRRGPWPAPRRQPQGLGGPHAAVLRPLPAGRARTRVDGEGRPGRRQGKDPGDGTAVAGLTVSRAIPDHARILMALRVRRRPPLTDQYNIGCAVWSGVGQLPSG